MAFDLSWLWSLLDSIKATLNSWFSGIWTTVQNIVNTGQGIYAGLLALGSQLWDAILKGLDTIGKALRDAYKWLYDGFIGFATIFGQWINSAMTWVGSGVAWIGSMIYTFGNWVYNAIYTTWDWFRNIITSAWNTIVSWFSGVASAIGTWWGSVVTGINTWFTNLLKTFRQKIITTIEADLTITMAWKGAERFLAPQKLSDFGYALIGIIASPVIGRLVGTIVDAVVPLPTSTVYPLIPDIAGFTYTPPTLTIPTPTEKAVPTPLPVGIIYPFIGVAEQSSRLIMNPTYEVNIMAGQDLSRQLVAYTYEVEVA